MIKSSEQQNGAMARYRKDSLLTDLSVSESCLRDINTGHMPFVLCHTNTHRPRIAHLVIALTIYLHNNTFVSLLKFNSHTEK